MLVDTSPNFITSAEGDVRREDTPSYALRAALALRLAAPSLPERPAGPPPKVLAETRSIAA